MKVIPLPIWLDEPLKTVGLEVEGLPSVKTETWNVTDFRKLPEVLESVLTDEAQDYPLWGKGTGQIDLSRDTKNLLLQGVTITTQKADVWDRPFLPHNPFPEINAALCPSERVITIESNLEIPLEVLFGTESNSINHRRLTVIVKEGVQATLLLTLQSHLTAFCTQNVRIIVEKEANFTLIMHQKASKNRHTITHFEAILGEKSHFDVRFLEEGGAFSRVHYDIRGEGKNANASLAVISLIGSGLQADHIATIDHRQYGIASKQVFKALIAPHGMHQIVSKTAVQKEGQKTDAHQKLSAVLLGDYAAHFARPELEIWADDVKCSHGSTVGQLDETALYYLRSRGLPLNEAQALLMQAFVFEELDALPPELDGYKDNLETYMKHWMRTQVV